MTQQTDLDETKLSVQTVMDQQKPEGADDLDDQTTSSDYAPFWVALYITIFWVGLNGTVFFLSLSELKVSETITTLSAPLAALPAVWIVAAVLLQMSELRNQRKALNQNVDALRLQADEIRKSVAESKEQTVQLTKEVHLRSDQDARSKSDQKLRELGELILVVDQKARNIFSKSPSFSFPESLIPSLLNRPQSIVPLFPKSWAYLLDESKTREPFSSDAAPAKVREFCGFADSAKHVCTDLCQDIVSIGAASQRTIEDLKSIEAILTEMQKLSALS